MAKRREANSKRRRARAASQADPPSGEPNVAPAVSKSDAALHPESACLCVVATPIGNLGDISTRALETLRNADLIACEDSRVTGNLLRRFGINTPMMPYHDHNANRVRPELMARLAAGRNVALVSDAGTPLISDPGYKLVRTCIDAGVPVTTIPGPSALVAALTVAGLPTDRVFFAGFLPVKSAARKSAAAEVRALPATLVFYESTRRLPESLADLAQVLGPRPAAVCRELTKLHEEVRRGTLDSLATIYRGEGPPKGEAVLVVAAPVSNDDASSNLDESLRRALTTMSVRDAAAAVAEALNIPRRQVYARALELANA